MKPKSLFATKEENNIQRLIILCLCKLYICNYGNVILKRSRQIDYVLNSALLLTILHALSFYFLQNNLFAAEFMNNNDAR